MSDRVFERIAPIGLRAVIGSGLLDWLRFVICALLSEPPIILGVVLVVVDVEIEGSVLATRFVLSCR